MEINSGGGGFVFVFFTQRGQEIAKVHLLLPGHVNEIKRSALHLLTWSKWLLGEVWRLHQRLAAALFSLAASADSSRGKQSAAARYAYTWPSSWAMVNAVLSPLSSMMLQLLYGSHTVPNSARPSPIEKEKSKSLHFRHVNGGSYSGSPPNKRTHLRCRTYPSPCRCPVCGQDTENGSKNNPTRGSVSLDLILNSSVQSRIWSAPAPQLSSLSGV